jgi:hypothetical protein
MNQITISHKSTSLERTLLAVRIIVISLLFILANLYSRGSWVQFSGQSYGLSQEEVIVMGEGPQSTLAQE